MQIEVFIAGIVHTIAANKTILSDLCTVDYIHLKSFRKQTFEALEKGDNDDDDDGTEGTV